MRHLLFIPLLLAAALAATTEFIVTRPQQSSISNLGKDRYDITEKMTIKGRTLDIKAPYTLKQEGRH